MENDEEIIEAGGAGAPEGAAPAAPEADEIKSMYDQLGIKAPAPTGKSKGRPKTADVRAKNADKNGAGDSDTGSEGKDADDKNESKNAPASNKDGDSGHEGNEDGKKADKNSGKLREESEEADDGVRKPESKSDAGAKSGRKEDADKRDERAGQDEDESGDEAQEGEDIEGKRPGKSNPKVEQRFQRLVEEKRERDEMIEKLQRELQETTQKQRQAQVAQEDPEYTIDDFRKVQDEDGNILELDPERAELAWRRWKDGYEQRSTERQAKEQHALAQQQQQEQYAEQIMRQSVAAYDTLADLMDEFPQLVGTSSEYDEEFARLAMPAINEAIVYAPGTEPGNAEGNKPVIAGLSVNPKTILAAMTGISKAKRTLSLNGIDDNVDTRSNVSVPHGRSSDPTVRAANDLYKELNIDKRL